MSATTAGTTWYRCMKCFNVQGQNAAPPPPPTPAVASHAQQSKYAMDQHPSYTGGSPARNAMPAVGEPGPQPRTTAAFPSSPEGCGVCGSSDVRFVLEADIGIDAASPAQSPAKAIVRSPFCSIACLASRLGLAPIQPSLPSIVDGHGIAHSS